MKLNFRLRKVTNYAHKKISPSHEAVKQFFGKRSVEKFIQNDIANALFNEWLSFDYRNKQGTSFLAEYYLKNPDSLTNPQLSQLEQVIKSERFEIMELLKVVRDKGISVRVVRTGEEFFVDDLSSSRSATAPSLFFNRLARVNDKWILVGCDNVSFPIGLSSEDRKQFARILNKEKNTCKLVLDLFGDRFATP